jgi:hypothetical protein
MRERLRQLRSSGARIAQSALVVALVAAFALAALVVRGGFSGSQPRGASAGADAATPAATATVMRAPTATVPLSGPTPSPVVRGPGPPGTGGPQPFKITAVTINPQQWTNPQPSVTCIDTVENTNAGDGSQKISLWAAFNYIPNTNGGDLTYRWHLSDGQVTPILTINARYPNYSMDLNSLTEPTDFTIPAGEADGRQWWAQVEVLTPNPLLSSRTAFYAPHCAMTVWYTNSRAPYPNDYYVCAGADVQTFTITGAIYVTPSPGGSITYHWQRYDGSTSPSYTVSVPPGADTVATISDTITLTSSSIQPKDGFTDLVIVTSLTPANPPSSLPTLYKAC